MLVQLCMGKTPVLLAFGKHHGNVGDMKILSEKRFFRGAVLPVLDESYRRNRKTAVIFEWTLNNEVVIRKEEVEAYRQGKIIQIQDKISAIEREIKRWEEGLKSSLLEPLDRGATIPNDLGFERKIAEINGLCPGLISCMPEPHVAEVILENKVGDLVWSRIDEAKGDDAIELMVEFIKAFAKAIVLRDKGVFELVRRLRRETPEISIVIPRGAAHSGMEVLFPRSEYDVSMVCSNVYFDFASEAPMRSYKKEISREELVDFARLQLDFKKHFEATEQGGFTTIHPWLRLGGMLIDGAFQTMSDNTWAKRSRRFAIEKNPDCAERLCIKK